MYAEQEEVLEEGMTAPLLPLGRGHYDLGPRTLLDLSGVAMDDTNDQSGGDARAPGRGAKSRPRASDDGSSAVEEGMGEDEDDAMVPVDGDGDGDEEDVMEEDNVVDMKGKARKESTKKARTEPRVQSSEY